MALFLITGGGGFIGSNLVKALISQGEKVRVLDNFSTGKRENIAEVLDQIELIEGDIRDFEIVKRSAQGVDYILHQAALPSVPRSIADPISSTSVNIDGTVNLLVAAKDCGVKKFVMASSSSVYGDSPTLPKHEELPPRPLSPYALTKLAGEQYCQIFSRLYGLKTVCLRYFNVFGPGQDPNSQYAAVIPKFIISLLRNTPPTVFGDGEQSRDFTFVENVIQANLLAVRSEVSDGSPINIACGQRISLNELLRELGAILSKKIEPIYQPPRPGDVKHSLAAIERARIYLGFKPVVNTQDGLRKTVDWFSRTLC
ncbi:MAG: SDR family oxidoreductase [bacterium]|nr:SDR family oxidoreductase [bacterium]